MLTVMSGESGLSLAEALMTLGLMCIFLTPALGMIRQSAVNYSHAYANYQTDLAVTGLLSLAKGSAGGGSDINVNMSGLDSRYEYEVIMED